jgi:hypothetical protein
MRQRLPISLTVGGVLWTILVIVFLSISAPTIFRGLAANSLERAQSFHSTDDYLRRLTDVSDASGKILESVVALSSQKPILILMREGDGRSGFLAMTVAYLAWPHEVQITAISSATADHDLAAINPAELSAVVFCRVAPPSWAPAGRWIGDTVKIVPLSRPPIAGK